MKPNKSFKQFAKDCPQHFSEEVLKHYHMEDVSVFSRTNKEKSTRNSPIRNKF